MSNNRVLEATFLISVLGHSIFLGSPFLFSQPKHYQEIAIKLEIEKPPLLPKIDKLGEEKKIKEREEKPENPKQELKPKQQVVIKKMLEKPKAPQEKIEIITPDKEAMFRYQDLVKRKLEESRHYPSWAKKQEYEGAVYLKFTILSNGYTQKIRVVHSSKYQILNEEALRTVKRAEPFPPIPKQLNTAKVQMDVTIIFTLQ